MVRKLSLLLFLFSISLFSQDEKRLALVIGNANYDKGVLKNPVNDARLIASTLDSLDFDVILKENLATKRDMTAAIREFGSKRSEYDVAFVYYAGHGIQISGENFLLPTKEVFEEEFDIMDYGVSVQSIMRYLEAQTNEVNILILDACRDNPFESNWNTTRSLKGGGLAKIPPPTGSLIAFSTDSGQTAPDGEGDNSIYTISLANNMLLEDTSIDQVFRNVRAEVLAQTKGMQRPVEATQLTGNTFYLSKKTMIDEIIEINDLYHDFKYIDAYNLYEKYFYETPENLKAIELEINLLLKLEKYEIALEKLNKHLKNYKNSDTVYFLAYKVSLALKDFDLALFYINEAIKINSENSDYYSASTYANYKLFLKKNKDKFSKAAAKNMDQINRLIKKNETPTNHYNLAYNSYLTDNLNLFIKSVDRSLEYGLNDSHMLSKLINCSLYFMLNIDLHENQKITDIIQSIVPKIITYSINSFPRNYSFYLDFAEWKIGENNEALELVNIAYEIDPYNIKVRELRGKILYNIAYDCLNKETGSEVIELDNSECNEFAYNAISDLIFVTERSSNLGVYNVLGRIHFFILKNEEKKAIEYFKKSNSNFWKIQQYISDAYKNLKDYNKSAEFLDKAFKNLEYDKKYHPTTEYKNYLSQLHLRKYYICLETKEYENAYKEVKQSYYLNPDRAQLDLIQSAIFNKDFEFAMKTAKNEFTKTNDKTFLILQSLILNKIDRKAESIMLFESLIKNPDDAYLLHKSARVSRVFEYCARYYLDHEDYKNAIIYIKRLIRVLKDENSGNKENPSNYYLLAFSYFKNGNFLEAYSNIEKALQLKGDLNYYDISIDESLYITLTEEKIQSLKDEIIQKFNQK